MSWDTTSLIVASCITLSLYNALELLILIFITFNQYRGLYFWSLLIASLGVVPYNLGYLLVYFHVTYDSIGFVIDTVGWWAMVTGQSVVLYSRLHLVLRDQRVLRAIVWMIMIDAVVLHIPTTVMYFGSRYTEPPAEEGFTAAFNVYEKLQMTGFTIQEFIISGIYVKETIHILNIISNTDTRRTIWQLLAINVIIILMDIALLAIEYRDLRVLEQAVKGVVYSVKLKLEFAILGKLVEVVRHGNNVHATIDTTEFVDKTRVMSDTAHAPSITKRVSHSWVEDEIYTEHIETKDMICESIPERYHETPAPITNTLSTRRSTSAKVSDEYAEAMREISRT